MKQSNLFSKTRREAPREEPSLNAQLLIRAGFVDKLMAGTYSYLPLGLLTLRKIQDIIRQEMLAVGGQEVLMPALAPKANYEATGRQDLDILFRTQLTDGRELLLNQSHEEIVVPLVKQFVHSYKDLPVAVFQIQDKFRNELRAKSGLLRGREFSMKDLYSFHADQQDFDAYYEQVHRAYDRIFERCGLAAKYTEASGGSFSKYSHEFQVVTESGEDTIYFCDSCDFCQNKEIFEGETGAACQRCGSGTIREDRAIEVGNIFPLKTKFSDAFDMRFAAEDGSRKPVIMGCYGIGPSRVMGTIAEVHNDENGLVWPASVAPLHVHVIALTPDANVARRAGELYEQLRKQGTETLLDDRADVSAGEKLAESDLMGLPVRVIVSSKTLKKGGVEIRARNEETANIHQSSDCIAAISRILGSYA